MINVCKTDVMTDLNNIYKMEKLFVVINLNHNSIHMMRNNMYLLRMENLISSDPVPIVIHGNYKLLVNG